MARKRTLGEICREAGIKESDDGMLMPDDWDRAAAAVVAEHEKRLTLADVMARVDQHFEPITADKAVISKTELARLRQNSERWEWVKRKAKWIAFHTTIPPGWMPVSIDDDEAVDAAIAAEKAAGNA